MIVDSHMHVLPPEVLRRLSEICETEPYFSDMAHSPRARFASCEEALEEMRTQGVDMGIVFGYAMEDQGLCREINDYVSVEVAKSQGALTGFMVLNPTKKGVEAEFARGIDHGLKGVGELFPEGQKFDLLGEEMSTLAGLCLEAGIPLMIHVNEQLGHRYAGKTSVGPVQAWEFARRHPGLSIIYPHLGGGLLFYELMPEVQGAVTTVWYDTAAVPFLYSSNIYRVARELGVMGRLLFGTDFPLLRRERYWAQFREAGLSPAEEKALGGENALRLLGSKEGF